MVIVLKPRKKPQAPSPPKQNRFTIQDIEALFANTKNWDKFYKENESKLWESKIDIYYWPVYPLHMKDDYGLYRCVLHPTIEVPIGPDGKTDTKFFSNIHYAEFISHCIYYKPEEHKKYIIEKLFGSHNNVIDTSTSE